MQGASPVSHGPEWYRVATSAFRWLGLFPNFSLESIIISVPRCRPDLKAGLENLTVSYSVLP